MIIKDITDYLEELAPLNYAEDFDNVGLLIGNYSDSVTGVLVTLDTLEKTVEEAITKKCNLIVISFNKWLTKIVFSLTNGSINLKIFEWGEKSHKNRKIFSSLFENLFNPYEQTEVLIRTFSIEKKCTLVLICS